MPGSSISNVRPTSGWFLILKVPFSPATARRTIQRPRPWLPLATNRARNCRPRYAAIRWSCGGAEGLAVARRSVDYVVVGGVVEGGLKLVIVEYWRNDAGLRSQQVRQAGYDLAYQRAETV
jgi:hypothetical protein